MNSQFSLIPNTKKTLLAMVRASVGTTLFRHSYFSQGTRTVDILKNGDLSCAFYVSSLLKIFGLVHSIHATVDGTVTDLLQSGWAPIPAPTASCIIVWKERKGARGELHKHIGFSIGGGKAISNESKRGIPTIHPARYRPIERMFIHPRLEH